MQGDENVVSLILKKCANFFSVNPLQTKLKSYGKIIKDFIEVS